MPVPTWCYTDGPAPDPRTSPEFVSEIDLRGTSTDEESVPADRG